MAGSYKPVSLEDVWDHYELTRDSLVQKKYAIEQNMLNTQGSVEPRFIGMTLSDLNDFFDDQQDEIDHRTSFFLIAAAEADLVSDFMNRAKRRRKNDTIGQEFRRIFKEECEENQKNIKLDRHILEIWSAKAKSQVGDFRGALNLRHWLAHGRHWTPKLGRNYVPSVVASIIIRLFEEIEFPIPNISS